MTLYDYNKLGQLTGVTDPLVHDTDITPCVGCAGNNEVNDPILHKTKYTRDIRNRITKEEPVPANTDRGTWTRTYDLNGYLKTLTDPAGPVATYAYDPAGRVTSISYSGGTDNISYIYDAYAGCTNGIGKLCQVTDGAGSTVFDYDANQRLKSETRTEAGQAYVTTYNLDDAGRLSSLQAPTGLTLQMGLDDVGRALQLSAILSGATTPLQTSASYNGADQLLYARFANNLTEQRSYDFDGRVSTIDVGLTDTDGDGMPDVWEQAHGFNPGNASDGALDPDADGLTNVQEYLAGTDPSVADTDGDGLFDGQDPQPTVSTASWFVPLRQMLQ